MDKTDNTKQNETERGIKITSKSKSKSKFTGLALINFKVKNKVYLKGSEYSTEDEMSFNYLISKGIINPKKQ